MMIVADDKICALDELFSQHELIKIPANLIDTKIVSQADILLVRSVTKVDANLLKNTSVKWVGTLTSGVDHLDLAWMEQAGIPSAHAKGANAPTVLEYVLSCIATLQLQQLLPYKNVRAGIIGAGVVGSLVTQALNDLGFDIIVSDPPRSLRDNTFTSTPLSLFSDLDLICLHCELTKTGEYPSYHLLSEAFLSKQKPGCILINAARGGVVATEALLNSSHLHLCLDVWEHEPQINVQLLQSALIATPHIAGYSFQAKIRAVLMLYQQLQQDFPKNFSKLNESKVKKIFGFNAALPVRYESLKACEIDINSHESWRYQILKQLDLVAATHKMQSSLLGKRLHEQRKIFEDLRIPFANRNEFVKWSN